MNDKHLSFIQFPKKLQNLPNKNIFLKGELTKESIKKLAGKSGNAIIVEIWMNQTNNVADSVMTFKSNDELTNNFVKLFGNNAKKILDQIDDNGYIFPQSYNLSFHKLPMAIKITHI